MGTLFEPFIIAFWGFIVALAGFLLYAAWCVIREHKKDNKKKKKNLKTK